MNKGCDLQENKKFWSRYTEISVECTHSRNKKSSLDQFSFLSAVIVVVISPLLLIVDWSGELLYESTEGQQQQQRSSVPGASVPVLYLRLSVRRKRCRGLWAQSYSLQKLSASPFRLCPHSSSIRQLVTDHLVRMIGLSSPRRVLVYLLNVIQSHSNSLSQADSYAIRFRASDFFFSV